MTEIKTMSMFEIDEVAAKRKEIENIATDIYDKLVVNKTIPSMKESIYAGYFLPKLLGESNEQDNIWISEWIGAVGSVATEVNVVDDYTGEVLFRSPPILQSGKLGLREGKGTLQDIVKEFMMRNGNPVTNPDGYIKRKLNETYNDLLTEFDNKDDIMRWRFILGKYGYLGDTNTKENQQYSGEPEEIDVEDLIIYD